VRLVASILVSVTALQGCGVIGLGIGLESPKTETIESRGIAVVEPGTEMEIVVETGVGRTTTIRGLFASVSEDVIVLETPEGQFAVNRHWVRRVTIDAGTQWAKGMLVGGAVDAGVLLVALLLAGGVGH